LEPSAFEPIDPARASILLDRAKQRSTQLRRRRLLLFFASGGGRRRAGSSVPSGLGAPRRFTPSTMAFGTVGVVVAIVIALVAVSLTSKGPGGGRQVHSSPPINSLAPVSVPASPTVLAEVTGVTPAVANAVGLPSTTTVAPPTVKTGQPPLTIRGLPGAVFIGGEFCPYCAAERWAIIMAFSRFGTFSGLSETMSSPWDVDPSTATFSFYGASYTSSVVTLDTVENESNDTDGLGTRTTLQPLTDLESSLWQRYDDPEGFPFLDIGNAIFVLSPSYDARVLAGLDQQDIAARLTNSNDPVTQAIVGTANYLTAAICSVVGPSASSTWCGEPAITKAATAMGLS
jgi:hypothetical protein